MKFFGMENSRLGCTVKVGNRLAYLDVWRAIACLLVYFHHSAVNLTFGETSFPGYYGVHLFFVLSGYLLGGKFLKKLVGGTAVVSTGNYILRRFLRIYPPYLVCLLAFVVLRSFTGTKPPELGNIAARAALVFNYVDRYDYFSINGVLWTLAIEMQFYLLLPVVAWLVMHVCSRVSLRALVFGVFFVICGLMSRCYEVMFVNHFHPAATAIIRFKWLTSHLDLFGWGILLRVFEGYMSSLDVCFGRKTALVGAGVGLSTLTVVALWSQQCGFWQDSTNIQYTVFCPTLACIGFAVLLGTTSLTPLGELGVFHLYWLQWIGRISYSVYLYHVGVLFAFNKLTRIDSYGLNWTIMCIVAALCSLPASLFLGWLSFKWLEEPFTRLFHSGAPGSASVEGAVSMPRSPAC